MTSVRLVLAFLAAAAALVASACGGGSDEVPAGSIAVVDGTEIPKAQLDALLDQARRSYKASKQQLPKAGTPEYQNLQTRYVAFLVQREQFRQAADELDLTLTDEDIDETERELIETRFEGKSFEEKEAAYETAVEQQGLTRDEVRQSLEISALTTKIFDAVTKDVKVTDSDVVTYYTLNQASYGTPESRDVRHILISEKNDDGEIDFAASEERAQEIRQQLENGADFAELAREVSADPGSKTSGGRLTISRGQTVPEFDKVAFELDRAEVSQPVKTQFGYHVIEALSPVRPANTTPLAKVRASIRTTLLQQKRTEVMSAWVEDLQEEYEGKISYAEGFAPPELPEVPTETE